MTKTMTGAISLRERAATGLVVLGGLIFAVVFFLIMIIIQALPILLAGAALVWLLT